MSAIAERVAAGAAFLDEQDPDWWRNLDLQSLDLGSCTRCVLGQLSGTFGTGLVVFDLDDEGARNLGFNTFIGFDALTAEWKRVITGRRSAS